NVVEIGFQCNHLKIVNSLLSRPVCVCFTKVSGSVRYMTWIYNVFLSSLISMINVPGVSAIIVVSRLISKSVRALIGYFTMPGLKKYFGVITSKATCILALINS